MKNEVGRFRGVPLMMSLCLLASCGGGDTGDGGEALALQIRRDLSQMTACSGQARLTADYESRVFSCVLDFQWDRDGGGTVTVVEPELVAGLQAQISPDTTALAYGEVRLDTGPLTDDGLSLLEALPTLYRAVTQGYLAAWDADSAQVRLTCRDGVSDPGGGLEAEAAFDRETGAPQTVSLMWDGRQVVSGEIQNFQMRIEEN